ncbi:cell division protein FtsQ [Herbaspirillum sp. RV1423]|uniref:alginate O-acetyltransferase AlgX-related protein n=1 Tax=Herbaspirillum sp. RV1423 TaxID=1443993 RepID=UPI0004B14971|nr:cell division protein FtsQ [Herbaspirillum sp. RV1423]
MPPSVAPVQPGGFTARASKTAGYALAALLGGGLISCCWLFYLGKVNLLPPVLTRDAAMHGEVTHKIAKQLSGAWLPQQAANLERGASWLLFHDTGPRVRSGCPGWLFLNQEFQIDRQAQVNADTKARAVMDIQQRLSRQGIALLVALVPDKSRIAADQLCGLNRPSELGPRAAQWIQALRKAGVSAMDLTPTLQPLAATAYLRTDTHWNETGARAAARAIAQQIQMIGVHPEPQKAFDVHISKEKLRPGDLVRLAGIDWLPLRWQPAPELVAATEITERQDSAQGNGDNLDDLLGDDQLPNIALIGTSFSRNSNFVGFLQLALSARIGSFAKDGGEFSGSAREYFSNPAFRQTPPKLVIWEIPERDLQTPYEPISWR